LPRGESFDLDFHTIPFHGEDALLQKHYVSKRSRRQQGLLAFVAQDADTHVFCYGNAQVRQENQNDEVLRFVAFWKERTGPLPRELIFDSKLTTYDNLSKLSAQASFHHLARRSQPMLQEVWPNWVGLAADPPGGSRGFIGIRAIDQRVEGDVSEPSGKSSWPIWDMRSRLFC
jgi:hypothetical protein